MLKVVISVCYGGYSAEVFSITPNVAHHSDEKYVFCVQFFVRIQIIFRVITSFHALTESSQCFIGSGECFNPETLLFINYFLLCKQRMYSTLLEMTSGESSLNCKFNSELFADVF